jgi:hypothetical protein
MGGQSSPCRSRRICGAPEERQAAVRPISGEGRFRQAPPQEREDNDDLHARAQPGRPWSKESGRPAVGLLASSPFAEHPAGAGSGVPHIPEYLLGRSFPGVPRRPCRLGFRLLSARSCRISCRASMDVSGWFQKRSVVFVTQSGMLGDTAPVG